MVIKRRDVAKERLWREVLRRQAQSGLSVAEFCRREGMSQPSFYAWRRTISRRDRQGARHSSRRPPAIGFLPLRVAGSLPGREAAVGSITFELAGTQPSL